MLAPAHGPPLEPPLRSNARTNSSSQKVYSALKEQVSCSIHCRQSKGLFYCQTFTAPPGPEPEYHLVFAPCFTLWLWPICVQVMGKKIFIPALKFIKEIKEDFKFLTA